LQAEDTDMCTNKRYYKHFVCYEQDVTDTSPCLFVAVCVNLNAQWIWASSLTQYRE